MQPNYNRKKSARLKSRHMPGGYPVTILEIKTGIYLWIESLGCISVTPSNRNRKTQSPIKSSRKLKELTFLSVLRCHLAECITDDSELIVNATP